MVALSGQAVPDLEKFMQTIRDKMATIQEMQVYLKDESLPPPRGRYDVCLSQVLILYVKIISYTSLQNLSDGLYSI